MDRDVYTAIADPTRRFILELLMAAENLTAGEIAAEFSGVSRPAVSRHLRILRECELVCVYKSGKNQHDVLTPEPLKVIRKGWLKGFAGNQVTSLKKPRQLVEPNNH